MRLLAIIFYLAFLGGCAMGPSLQILEDAKTSPTVQHSPIQKRLEDVPIIDGEKITIAVYQFSDKTGQRKPSDGVAKLSSAVTQGGEIWVIKALQDVGNEGWFNVVERVGMDNLIKERQLIRQTRQNYEGKEAELLEPLLFAGLILEGGVVGYDSNVAVGGVGARWLGVGAQTQYRIDTVTVGVRIVSVGTGKVLLSIATEKTIASHQSGADIFKFLDMGTRLLETETGFSVNEPVNYATRAAIEQAVVELVYEGERKGLWKFKDNTYKGTLPKVRPMILSEALEKWPDSRLYCDANDMCRPKTEEDIQEGNNEVKNVDNTSNGNVNGTSGDGE
jgi:curli production assembly/transport component CsgG